MKWAWLFLVLFAIASVGWFIARKSNPTRPLIGEPTAANYEQFARRFNNLMVEHGAPIHEYKQDLRRTDSVTNPLIGVFDSDAGLYKFTWKDGKWVAMGNYQDIADLAQK